jgi:hypothetical protein
VGCRGPFRYSVGLSLQFFFFLNVVMCTAPIALLLRVGVAIVYSHEARPSRRFSKRTCEVAIGGLVFYSGTLSCIYIGGLVHLYIIRVLASQEEFFCFQLSYRLHVNLFFLKQKTNLVYMESRKTNYFLFHCRSYLSCLFFLHIFERETRNPETKNRYRRRRGEEGHVRF